MNILKKIFQVGVFILQFVIAGYFLFNSTFIHVHFMARLSAELNTIDTCCIENPQDGEIPAADESSVPGDTEKTNPKSADESLYFQIVNMAGLYLAMPVNFKVFKKLLSFLKRFFTANNSPPDIIQFYLFRGPPVLPF